MIDITDKCKVLSIQLIDRSIKNDDGTIDNYSKKFIEVDFDALPFHDLIREVVIIGNEKCFCIEDDFNGACKFEVIT